MRRPSGPPTAPPEVRGRALLGLLAWTKQHDGPSGVAHLVAHADGYAAECLRSPVAPQDWYPYPAFASLLRTVDAEFGDGDLELCREIGIWAGDQDLRGFLERSAILDRTPQRIVDASRLAWTTYYRHAGRLETVRSDPSDTRLRLRDFDAMDPAHCRLMEGWLIGVMQALGCRVAAGSREILCPSRGGPYHEFAGTWQPR